MTPEERDAILLIMERNIAARRRAQLDIQFHGLIFDSDTDPSGVRCDTEWCTAFTDPRAECGDRQGPYVGFHFNRIQRAEARIDEEHPAEEHS